MNNPTLPYDRPAPHTPLGRLTARTLTVTAATAALLALTATAASAHGVTGTGGRWYSFIWSGFIHMLAGWDHLLFAGGVLLLSGGIRRGAQMIFLFALGHSTTLIIATMAGWRINATFVDVVIALSLVFVGVVGFFGRPTTWRWFGLSVLGFGLIHGLGLSTRLQDIGLPHDTMPLLARVISFNVGVELGQLLALGLMYMAGDVAKTYLTWRHTWKATHATLAGVGVVAALLLATGVIGVSTAPDEAETESRPTAIGSCQVRERTETYPADGGHPSGDFFNPAQTPPWKDFGHVIGDSWVIVHYRPDLPAAQLTELASYIAGDEGKGVAGGAEPGLTGAFKAVNRYDTLMCQQFDLPALNTFAKNWFTDPRSDTGQP
ncbi:HupE/UreJ family protein [Catellatospora sichuanensis]|uniref:HupE/UreJ family protein n=1 Tax=Catellatospora sichuanensis TaxID=1969805 RepID=UPI0011844287|nr:HupE/UreJ family protein [Catellatospora sichuanensis]